jgi:hypothetical protein
MTRDHDSEEPDMTDEFTYTPEQALARSILLTAVNGASLYWARVHGYTVNCAPAQVHAEGVDTLDDRSLWHVDLDAIQRSITKLIEQPAHCAAPDSGIDPDVPTNVGLALQAALIARRNNLPLAEDARVETDPRIADIVFQVAVADEVIY